ncbi:MAG: T9SS type A sorting domain-containing protein, partial [Bacteroidota bacterium]
ADSEARSSVVLLARVLNLSADERSSADDIQLQAGNTYDLDFTAEDLYGLQGTLELGAGLELVDISYGLASVGNINLENAAEGIITFSWDDAMVASSSEASRSSEVSSSLFTLSVRATADATLSEVLSLTDRITRSEAYPTFGGVANLTLNFSADDLRSADEFALGQNSPNPVDAATQIAFTLPVANTATLTIRDVQGRTILVREIEAAAGVNLINLQRSDLAASGVYSYTLTSGEHTATKQMVIR